MRLFINNVTSLLITALMLTMAGATTNAAQTVSDVSIERGKRGIPARLLDKGDYYQHPDGRRLSFYRKKDVYAIRKIKGRANLKTLSSEARVKSQFGSQVEFLAKHRLGATQVVRIKNNAKAKHSFSVSPQMIKSLDSSIAELEPVLADARGNGDILLSSKLIIQLSDASKPRDLKNILARYNLTLERRLKSSGLMYSVNVAEGLDTSSKFALVRRIMNDSRVEWAQPQFRSRAFKTTFEPNDALFGEQWHLRNTGKGGSRCDTDCDANNAWDIGNANGTGAVSGAGTVIAVIDDGIQLNHEDLTLWQNLGETGGGKETNGIDDDGNGYIDDWRGWDFVDDDSSQAGSCGEDSTRGPDNDPNPQPFTACVTPDGDDVEQDNHGTAVAGIAAAKGNNSLGVAGTAYSAAILPIRLISAFDANAGSDFCARVVEAMTYAGTYADVINNSWGMDEGTCVALDTVINDIVDGTLADLNGTIEPRRDGDGSPVIFASGNNASGWVKVTVPVPSAGEHAYEWRFLRSAFPENDLNVDDAVWLDDIVFPDGSVEAFETGLGGFTTQCALNNCESDCDGETISSCPLWSVNSNQNFSRSGQSATVSQLNSLCTYSYLHTTKEGPAGEISFWIWVSADLQNFADKVEFLIDGQQVISYGDLPRFVDNAVGYPANVIKSIAVGASDAGQLSGTTTASLVAEERSFYSQYGPTLDVLAPSDNQHLGIVTTDRYGASGEGYNSNRDIGGNTSSAADPRYTDNFGGTSAAAPVVAGVAAAMIAADNNITAAQVESTLRATADKIGRRGAAAYDQVGNTRSDFYGYGRVNMFRALKSVLGENDVDSTTCNPEPFNYSRTSDLVLAGFTAFPQLDTPSCPARGPLVPDNSTCHAIKTANGNVAVFCL